MGTEQFRQKKDRILQQLQVPSHEYADASPKGSVDEPIRELIDEINQNDTLITTSSCSGRISVYVEGTGKPTALASNGSSEAAGKDLASTGKGGGRWTYVSHEPVDPAISTSSPSADFHKLFELQSATTESVQADGSRQSLVHFKFEPMILHIMTASVYDAQKVLTAALSAGFRESGAVSLTTSPMVAVRSNGLTLDSIIGYQDDAGRVLSLVDESYLRTLVALANSRFKSNTERIQRFRTALLDGFRQAGVDATDRSRSSTEERASRREQNKLNGLNRQAQIKAAREAENDDMVSSPETSVERDVFLGLGAQGA